MIKAFKYCRRLEWPGLCEDTLAPVIKTAVSSFISAGSTALLYIKQTCFEPPHQTTGPGCTECLLSSKKGKGQKCIVHSQQLGLDEKRSSGKPDFPARFEMSILSMSIFFHNWIYNMIYFKLKLKYHTNNIEKCLFHCCGYSCTLLNYWKLSSHFTEVADALIQSDLM